MSDVQQPTQLPALVPGSVQPRAADAVDHPPNTLLPGARTFGMIMTAVCILAVVLLLLFGKEHNRLTWVGIYVFVALTTGFGFWTLDGSPSTSLQRVGIRLGGAAATGAIFMILARQVTPPVPPTLTRIVYLEKVKDVNLKRPSFRLEGGNGGFVEPPVLSYEKSGSPNKQVVVTFAQEQSQGEFKVAWEEEDALLHGVKYTVPRYGDVEATPYYKGKKHQEP